MLSKQERGLPRSQFLCREVRDARIRDAGASATLRNAVDGAHKVIMEEPSFLHDDGPLGRNEEFPTAEVHFSRILAFGQAIDDGAAVFAILADDDGPLAVSLELELAFPVRRSRDDRPSILADTDGRTIGEGDSAMLCFGHGSSLVPLGPGGAGLN